MAHLLLLCKYVPEYILIKLYFIYRAENNLNNSRYKYRNKTQRNSSDFSVNKLLHRMIRIFSSTRWFRARVNISFHYSMFLLNGSHTDRQKVKTHIYTVYHMLWRNNRDRDVANALSALCAFIYKYVGFR